MPQRIPGRAAVFFVSLQAAGYKPFRSLSRGLLGVSIIPLLCLAGGVSSCAAQAGAVGGAPGGAIAEISTATVSNSPSAGASPESVAVSTASHRGGVSVPAAGALAVSPAGGREEDDSGKAPAPELPGRDGLFQASAGNVGIGTKKPRAKLEVRGDVIITGELRVEGRGRKDRECLKVAFDTTGAAVCGDGFSAAGIWKAGKAERETGGVVCCR